MSYSRSEYHKEEDRNNSNQDGGWRSWFGLGSNKDRDDDRGYSYQRTTTYRDDQPRSGQYSTSGDFNRPSYNSSQQYYGDRDRFGVSGGVSSYGGERGGYGYQTTGEASSRYGQYGPSSGPSYGPSYGQSYGQQYGQSDRDYNNRDGSYYRAETRTYGGDRDYPRYGGESQPQQRYGGAYGGEYTSLSRPSYYNSNYDRSPSRGYGLSGDVNVSYPRGGQPQDYSYSRTTTYGGDRDRSYGGDRGFSGDYSSSRYGGPSGGYSSSYRY